MTSFPNSPRLLKGAIVGIDKNNPAASVIVFQYNPETMTRKVEARAAGGGETGDRSEALRLTSAPKETITISVDIDATDQLERAESTAVTAGLNPTLAALEMLFYPKSSVVLENIALAAGGMLVITPTEAPLTLFVWGPTRVLPVRITSFSITEQAFDTLLNPIQAKVDLTMQVLSYYDLETKHPGFSLFVAYQIAKEIMATKNTFNNAQSLGVSLKL
ncbi:MAG: hypothetical protein QOK37_3634 [Thermoanaerobaculia bacterium]|jgi:hypothetical protein|nr:hypothetical protein [Thermoanaerobaculia bacterium]